MKRGTLWTNVLRQAVNPRRLGVMVRKLGRRYADERGTLSAEAVRSWVGAHCRPSEAEARKLDGALWDESRQFGEALHERAAGVLEDLGVTLGGGGAYPLLYFATRYLRPFCIVETGAAAWRIYEFEGKYLGVIGRLER